MFDIMVSLIFCVVIPFLVMAMLARSFEKTAPKVDNYRGVKVYNSLGIVWFVWIASFWAGAHFISALGFQLSVWIQYLVPLFPLIAGSCILGLLDDWAGEHTKGFQGHLSALSEGMLTVGGLKMIGIGVLSLFTMVSLYWVGISSVPRIIFGTCVIALAANTVNLFDLRPARAGKVYLLGLACLVACIACSPLLSFDGITLAAIIVAGLGPLIAVWRFDAGEKGMLGDAGANSMGAFLGFMLATALPTWGLFILTIVLLALNILSERVSFSEVIRRNRILYALDKLGRKDRE
jgi:hypothetical protein